MIENMSRDLSIYATSLLSSYPATQLNVVVENNLEPSSRHPPGAIARIDGNDTSS